MRSVRALLEGILDYAGLFPPAKLDLQTALKSYREYRAHPHGWILSRFVLPLEQVHEASKTGRVTLTVRGDGVRLPPNLPPNVEAIELAGSLAEPPSRFVFEEIDWRGDFHHRISALPLGRGVKLRTGGLTADAIPPMAIVAQFLWSAAKAKAPIKFTAGLHHPFAEGGQHGFLNVFVAALAAYHFGAPADQLESLLAEVTVRFTDGAFHAGRFVFPLEDLIQLRSVYVTSFGSCSFLEPVEALAALRIL